MSLHLASLSTATSCALVVAKFDLFCSLLHQLALYTLCQYGTPSQVDAHLIALPSCFEHPLVIVIFATSQDLSCFVANSATSLLILLPIEALPSITNSIIAPESPSPLLSLQQRRPPAFRPSLPGRQCCRTALPLIDTRSRQLDRRFQVHPSHLWYQASARLQ